MNDSRPPHSLSPPQMEVMKLVWERGEISVGEVWREIAAKRGVSRNTIQTTMTRLEERGWLEHRKVGQTFFFRAVHPRSDTLGTMVARFVETAFSGSAEGLIHALLEGRGLSGKEAEKIRRMIESAQARRHEGR